MGIINSLRNLLFIVAITCNNCTSAQDHNTTNLKGTWGGCHENGSYAEILFSKYECMVVSNDLNGLIYAVPYSVRRNEIHTTNIELGKIFVDTFQIKSDSILIRNENGEFKLKKLYDFPAVPLKPRLFNRNVRFSDSVLYVHYMRMFLIREAEHECKSN